MMDGWLEGWMVGWMHGWMDEDDGMRQRKAPVVKCLVPVLEALGSML